MAGRRLTTEQRAKIFKALADPKRIDIVDALIEGSPMCGTALAETLGVSLALVCHHWEVLVEAGVLRKERVGQLRVCSLDVERIREALQGWGLVEPPPASAPPAAPPGAHPFPGGAHPFPGAQPFPSAQPFAGAQPFPSAQLYLPVKASPSKASAVKALAVKATPAKGSLKKAPAAKPTLAKVASKRGVTKASAARTPRRKPGAEA